MTIISPHKPSKANKEQLFVEFVIDRCKQDKGFSARLRRADNPATEYQSWETLGSWVDLDELWQRLPYATIAAAIARAKAEKNGSLRLGQAIALCYTDKIATNENSNNTPGNVRLRRLLACNDVQEVCRVIRPILTLISSKVNEPLDYSQLLSELRYFGEKSKIRWAQDFYRQMQKTTWRDEE